MYQSAGPLLRSDMQSTLALEAATGLAGVPRPVTGELSRPRVLAHLSTRWDHAVTVVTAGAGFGKTTALAQAVRDNLRAPRGYDVWLGCEPGRRDPAAVARTVAEALHVPLVTSDPLVAVLDAIRSVSPVDVCLVIDDVHEVGDCPTWTGFIGTLLHNLPRTAHVVLAGRQVPELPLARLRAAGQVVEMTQNELAFTEPEVEDLARRVGRESGSARTLGGWPALVRLSLAARPAVAREFVQEEVLGQLSEADRTALAALSYLGSATDDVVSRVVGVSAGLEELSARVPLIDALDDGRYRAHGLWTDALERVIPVSTAASLRAQAIDVLVQDSELARAGSLAARSAEWGILAQLSLELVRSTVSVTPLDLADRWLAAVAPDRRGDPEFVLLAAAAAHARDYTDPEVGRLADEAYARFIDRGDGSAAGTALAVAVVSAHARADLGRLFKLACQAGELPDLDDSPILRLLVHGTAAVVAELMGDPEAALEELALAPLEGVPTELAISFSRIHAHCLVMAGRAAEAAELATRTLADAEDEHVRLIPAMTRWLAGDAGGLIALHQVGDRDLATGARDAFVEAAITTMVAASTGHRRDSQDWPRLCRDGLDNPRDSALAASCAAALGVLDHDELAAQAALAAHLTRYPLDVALGERHLRRFLAIGYVLDDSLRAFWDSAELGPSHVAARDAARALLAARAGALQSAAELPRDSALCFLPMPWAVELACRLVAAGQPTGLALAGWLADLLGSVVQDELRRLSLSGDAAVGAGATAVLGTLPMPPTGHLHVDLLGPVRLVSAGVVVDRPQLRRARVRELLAALVVSGSVTRERAMALLWPELGPDRAQHNLRVTLTHLRRLLEPERSAGDASYHLRVDGEVIRLFASPALTVDVWEFDRLLAEAANARSAGDTHLMGELLMAAVELRRGGPLTDLRRLPELEGEIDRINLRYVDAAMTLGELRLVEGASRAAQMYADRALAVEPYEERAHRLAIAAALHSHDPARARACGARLLGMLRELGIEPEAATAILLRRAAAIAAARRTTVA